MIICVNICTLSNVQIKLQPWFSFPLTISDLVSSFVESDLYKIIKHKWNTYTCFHWLPATYFLNNFIFSDWNETKLR